MASRLHKFFAGTLAIASSTKLGLTLLSWAIVYLAAASIAPRRLAGLLGTGPDELYRHALLLVPLAGLCLSMIAATMQAIPLTVSRAGAWIAHAGVIMLATGAVAYAIASVSGQAVSFRIDNAFSRLDRFYLSNTAALYVVAPESDHAVVTPLPRPSDEQPLEFQVSCAAPAGLSIAAHRYQPDATGGSLQVRISQGQLSRDIDLQFAPFMRAEVYQPFTLSDGRTLYLAFSRQARALPATLRIDSIQYESYLASSVPKDFRCDISILGDNPRSAVLALNKPLSLGPYQLSQSAWLPDPARPDELVFAVSSRPGLWMAWAGCAAILVGMAWSFALRPLLEQGRAD